MLWMTYTKRLVSGITHAGSKLEPSPPLTKFTAECLASLKDVVISAIRRIARDGSLCVLGLPVGASPEGRAKAGARLASRSLSGEWGGPPTRRVNVRRLPPPPLRGSGGQAGGQPPREPRAEAASEGWLASRSLSERAVRSAYASLRDDSGGQPPPREPRAEGSAVGLPAVVSLRRAGRSAYAACDRAPAPADSLRENRERRLVSRLGIEPRTRRLRGAQGERNSLIY